MIDLFFVFCLPLSSFRCKSQILNFFVGNEGIVKSKESGV